MLYIILALILFGILIAVHEFGHFAAAKFFGVQVNEFSIGMGPALFKKQKGETLYSLRLFPVGGYCAMEGEDEEESSDNPRALGNTAGWKQAVILVAGAFMNFVTGLLIVLLLYAGAAGFKAPIYAGPLEGYGTESCGLQEGDRFLSVDGHAILVYSNVSLYLSRAGDDVDFVVERGGEKLELNGVHIPYQERTDGEGNYTRLRGISIGYEVDPPTVGNKLLYAWNTAVDYVRLVWISLGDLITGAVGLRDLSGPVGIVSAVDSVYQAAAPSGIAAVVLNMLNFGVLVTANLGIMNLLPIPALDGGRLVFLIIEAVRRKRVPPEKEGMVHFAGFAVLMVLMVVVMFNDIVKLF